MANYIRDRYGDPANAWAHELSAGWYASGGFAGMPMAGCFADGGMVTASQPTLAVFGENGPETALFLPHMASGGFTGGTGLPLPAPPPWDTAAWDAWFNQQFNYRFNQQFNKVFNQRFNFNFEFNENFNKAFNARFNAQFNKFFNNWWLHLRDMTQADWMNMQQVWGGSLSVLQAIEALKPGTSLKGMGLSRAMLRAMGISNGQADEGTSLAFLQNLQQEQGGTLTPAQMKMARRGVFNENWLLQKQVTDLGHAIFDEQWSLTHGHLSKSQRNSTIQAMQQATEQMLQLKAEMQSNKQALKDLTKATKDNTQATMTGSVSFTYQGQQYNPSLSSDNTVNLAVGG
jgi:hypothetical protein